MQSDTGFLTRFHYFGGGEVPTQQGAVLAHFRTVSTFDGLLKMLRDQNPGLSLRFDPKFADLSDSELLTIVAGESTVAMPWRVKLHALKQLGRR